MLICCNQIGNYISFLIISWRVRRCGMPKIIEALGMHTICESAQKTLALI